jgi:hypothetical protein
MGVSKLMGVPFFKNKNQGQENMVLSKVFETPIQGKICFRL